MVPRSGEQLLTGSALVRGDEADAVARSVLDALNRPALPADDVQTATEGDVHEQARPQASRPQEEQGEPRQPPERLTSCPQARYSGRYSTCVISTRHLADARRGRAAPQLAVGRSRSRSSGRRAP